MSAQATALQSRLSTLGVVAKVVGAALRLSPASKVPPDLLAEVRSHKAAMIALLTAPVASAVVAPPQSILGLFPADRGYLARQPVPAAHAIPPSPAVAALPDILPAPDHPAEPIAEPWPDEGEAGVPRRYPGAVGGLLRASQCRPVSWADPAARPSPGSWCRNCEYSRWWGDASGWRCWACHPPTGLAASDIEEVRT